MEFFKSLEQEREHYERLLFSQRDQSLYWADEPNAKYFYELNQDLADLWQTLVKSAITADRRVLARKKQLLIRTDDYGVVDDSRWQKELGEYLTVLIAKCSGPLVESRLIPINRIGLFRWNGGRCSRLWVDITKGEIASVAYRQHSWRQYEPDGLTIFQEGGWAYASCFLHAGQNFVDEINLWVNFITDNEIASTGVVKTDELSGVDYELYCLKILANAGWKVSPTKATGDQGVDLIAEMGGQVVCLQCKRYGQPVGNKAVQEVVSGKTFYRGDYAVVVSNASYTQSAKELAQSTGAFLISDEDLIHLNEIINASL